MYREGSRRFRSGAHLHGGTHMNVGSGASPHTPGQGAPRSPLRRNKIISQRDKIKIPKKGGITIGGEGNDGISFLPPLPTPQWTWRARNQPSPPLYIVGRCMGASPLPLAQPSLSQVLLLSRGAWRSPAGLPRSSTTTTPLCCCWMESSQPLPLSLLDQGMGDVTGLYVC